MSEDKIIPPIPIDVKCIKENSTITVEVPGIIHKRLQDLLMHGLPFSDAESLQKILSSIKTSNEDPDATTYHTRTILWLLSQIEDAAEKQGKIEIAQIDKNTGKVI